MILIASRKIHNPFRILPDHISNTHSGHHLHQIRREPLKQSPPPLSPNRPGRNIPHTTIHRWVDLRPLTLQSCPQQIERVNNTRPERPAEGTNPRGGDVGEADVALVDVEARGFLARREKFQILEGGEVDGAVGEHA